jgi:hypothetical protein
MKVRIVIEYDPDWPDGVDVTEALVKERQDWLDGHIDIGDINPADISFDAIPCIQIKG